jgi:hypothetical protein
VSVAPQAADVDARRVAGRDRDGADEHGREGGPGGRPGGARVGRAVEAGVVAARVETRRRRGVDGEAEDMAREAAAGRGPVDASVGGLVDAGPGRGDVDDAGRDGVEGHHVRPERPEPVAGEGPAVARVGRAPQSGGLRGREQSAGGGGRRREQLAVAERGADLRPGRPRVRRAVDVTRAVRDVDARRDERVDGDALDAEQPLREVVRAGPAGAGVGRAVERVRRGVDVGRRHRVDRERVQVVEREDDPVVHGKPGRAGVGRLEDAGSERGRVQHRGVRGIDREPVDGCAVRAAARPEVRCLGGPRSVRDENERECGPRRAARGPGHRVLRSASIPAATETERLDDMNDRRACHQAVDGACR